MIDRVNDIDKYVNHFKSPKTSAFFRAFLYDVEDYIKNSKSKYANRTRKVAYDYVLSLEDSFSDEDITKNELIRFYDTILTLSTGKMIVVDH